MSRSRRVPDPTQELRIEDAIEQLRTSLREEDPLVPVEADPFTAAGTHLSRCKPQPSAHQLAEHWLIPASGCRCCGKAIVIKRLVAEVSVPPVVRRAYEATAKAKPVVDELASTLAPALRDLLEAFQAQTTATAEQALEMPRRRQRAPATRDRSSGGQGQGREQRDLGAAERWLPESLRLLEKSVRGDETGEALRAHAWTLAEALFLVSEMRAKLEARLLTYFASPEFHLPHSGAGRLTLGFLKECARVLSATGHEASEIAKLLPYHGESGATARIHDHLRPKTRPPAKASKGKAAPEQKPEPTKKPEPKGKPKPKR